MDKGQIVLFQTRRGEDKIGGGLQMRLGAYGGADGGVVSVREFKHTARGVLRVKSEA